MGDRTDAESPRPLFKLIADIPGLLVNLIKAELRQLTAELSAKAKSVGVAVALFAVAAVFAFFALGVGIAAAVLGLALVVPAWLAAVIVFVALLLLAGILALVGRSSLKKMGSLTPATTIASVKDDAEALKGVGKFDN